MSFYHSLQTAKARKQKKLAILIDPDHKRISNLRRIVEVSRMAEVDYFFVGGSLLVEQRLEDCLDLLRSECDIPLILFPGSNYQLSNKADAILFLSLISGRNPDMLIGKHVIAAPYLRKSRLEVVPTGYILIDGGKHSTASYMTNTQPIPPENDEIAICTAQAGEFLGLKLIYLDAGSGARNPVSASMVRSVSHNVDVPVIVGGGIRTAAMAAERVSAGADLLVVGNAIEKDPDLVFHLADVVHREKLISGS